MYKKGITLESVINTDRISYKRTFNMKRPKLDLNRNSIIDAKQVFFKRQSLHLLYNSAKFHLNLQSNRQ